MKWAVHAWEELSAERYERTEPEKLKGHLSNDRVETARHSGLHTGSWENDRKKKGRVHLDPHRPTAGETLRWRRKRTDKGRLRQKEIGKERAEEKEID